jgi:hypothetical protein
LDKTNLEEVLSAKPQEIFNPIKADNIKGQGISFLQVLPNDIETLKQNTYEVVPMLTHARTVEDLIEIGKRDGINIELVKDQKGEYFLGVKNVWDNSYFRIDRDSAIIKYGPQPIEWTGVDKKWSKTKQIFTDEIGEHCAVTVDKNGGIHIAAYNRSGADLYYAYLSGKDATPKTCLVDSYSQIGKYISIDVAFNSDNSDGKAVPYISYLGEGFGGLPKVAYLPTGINDSTELKDGADNNTDMFTGVWEVSLIPTSSYVCEDNMNVAVWKDTSGKIKTSVKEANPTSSTTSGTSYGNGTSQFVLGYATEEGVNGYIETAQLK